MTDRQRKINAHVAKIEELVVPLYNNCDEYLPLMLALLATAARVAMAGTGKGDHDSNEPLRLAYQTATIFWAERLGLTEIKPLPFRDPSEN